MLRFGIVGCGSIGGYHARTLTGEHSLAPHAVLVAVASRNPDRARALAERTGVAALSVDELLASPDIDVVTVCTPSGDHGELAGRALRHGKHVLVEKPVETRLATADHLIATAERTGRTLGVVSQHRFDAAARIAKEAITRGELGTLTSVTVEVPLWRGPAYYADSWRGTHELDGGGALINQGVHQIDLAQYLAGPITEVSAHTTTRAHDIEVEDVVTASLRFDSGALGTVLATTAAYPGRTTRLSVNGDRGSLVIDSDELVYFHAAEPGAEVAPYGAYGAGNQAAARLAGYPPHAGLDRDQTHLPYQPLRDQLLDFCQAVESGRAPLVDGHEARRALAAVLAVYESARSGGIPVRLKEKEPVVPTASDLAGVFDRCADTYERVGVEHFGPMGKRLVEAAELKPGQSVLDAGCGTGACLVPAAHAVGPTGGVIGIDISPRMVERAAEAAAGLSQVRTAVADAETVRLDLPYLLDGTFDAVISGMALFFVPNPEKALLRFSELLKPGGRLAFSWWGPTDPHWDPVFAASAPYGRAASAHTTVKASPFRAVEPLHQLVTGSGFTDVRTTEFELTTRFADSRQWWEFVWSTAGRMFWESVSEVDSQAAVAAVRRELDALAGPDGSLTTTATVRLTTAVRA